jgi:hypothetical protein
MIRQNMGHFSSLVVALVDGLILLNWLFGTITFLENSYRSISLGGSLSPSETGQGMCTPPMSLLMVWYLVSSLLWWVLLDLNGEQHR